MTRRRVPVWSVALGAILLAFVLLVVFWRWDWFVPLLDRRASAALGRKVTVEHLHVRLGRTVRIVVDDVRIANPDGFPADSRFATVEHLAVDVDVASLLHDRSVIRIPRIEVTRPQIDAYTAADGRPNWNLTPPSSSGGSSPSIKVGDLQIEDGHAHVVDPKLKADFAIDFATHAAVQDRGEAQIMVDAKGTYAAQPITGHFVGGAVLSLRDPSHPYPIDLEAANGPTKVAIKGTVEDPLAFKGANIQLDISGPDMAPLFHLTGIPIPETPPYQVHGKLDYADSKIRFNDFTGKMGRSDLAGGIALDPGAERPKVTADLTSRTVDLADLGGFIGTTPARAGEAQTPQQQREKAQEAKSPNLLPDQPINLPKLQAADVDLKYRGQHIAGRSIPLDDLAVDLTIRNGDISLHPISFGVGKGRISGTVALSPRSNKAIGLKADIEFHQLDVSRIMSATHTFGGAGTIGGRAVIDGSGTSVAQVMGHANGDLKLFMTGGDLSALLVDLAGLDFGNSLLSAIGLPSRAEVRCMVVDMPLDQGILNTRVLLLDTTEANIVGSGSINLRNETVDYQIKTDAKHFNVGKLDAPIDIRGSLKAPSVLPDPAQLAARVGAAALLGTLLTPLAALLPTIQLGLGKDTDCSKTVAAVGAEGKLKLSPADVRARTGAPAHPKANPVDRGSAQPSQ